MSDRNMFYCLQPLNVTKNEISRLDNAYLKRERQFEIKRLAQCHIKHKHTMNHI